MGRPKKEREPLPPIWEAPDELWAMIEPILAKHDPPKREPKRIDQRAAWVKEPGSSVPEPADRGERTRYRSRLQTG